MLGMQQLQTLQASQLNTPKKEDAPESVKTGITALPKLAPPDPSEGSLDFQDWLQQISGLMSDFSDSSQVWWSAVVQVSKDAYDRWVTASPIEGEREGMFNAFRGPASRSEIRHYRPKSKSGRAKNPV